MGELRVEKEEAGEGFWWCGSSVAITSSRWGR